MKIEFYKHNLNQDEEIEYIIRAIEEIVRWVREITMPLLLII